MYAEFSLCRVKPSGTTIGEWKDIRAVSGKRGKYMLLESKRRAASFLVAQIGLAYSVIRGVHVDYVASEQMSNTNFLDVTIASSSPTFLLI
jgi:hypothetical protein